MASTIRGISSMATRLVLADLAAAYQQQTGTFIRIESIGGVDAAQRVVNGDPFDVVLLAADAIDQLIAAGHAQGQRVDLMRSGVAVAVPRGADRPDLGSEEAVKQAVLAAPTIGYSTGPSGTALLRLFERWGIAAQVKQRTVQAPPGIPVGTMVARGEVALGFQQHSELMNLHGIDVVGPLPPAIQITTVFSGAVCTVSSEPQAARDLLAFLASADAAQAKRRQGMDPA